jgi:glycosyltransferase involved in cell wall biosynthesis
LKEEMEKIMKVWIVSDGEPLIIDGSNTRLRRMGNLAEFLSSEGHHVTWFSTTYDHHNKKQRSDTDVKFEIKENYTLNLSHVKGYKNNVSINRLISRYMAARSISSKFSKEVKPDIIIATMAHVDLTNYACEYGKDNNIPVVVDVRDLWPAFVIDMVKPWMKPVIMPYIKFHEAKLSNMMKKAYGIIGLSEYFLNYGLNFAKRKKKKVDTIIPIGYPNYDYSRYKNSLDHYWDNLSEDDFIIACTGTFSHQFDYKAVIEASNILKEHKNIKFVLCGTGVQFEDVKSKVGSNVIMPGWIGKDQIASLITNSKLGLIPYINGVNFRGNTPNKFGEYLSAGLPILVSVRGSMEKLLEENACGSYYSNGQELAKKILLYQENLEKQRSSSINSRSLYENQFNSDKVTKILADFLYFVTKTYKSENM